MLSAILQFPHGDEQGQIYILPRSRSRRRNNHNDQRAENLEHLALIHRIDSIYKTCDTIEGLEDSLNALRSDDHHFKNYQIIYLVVPGEPNNICLNNYYYSLQEIAEVFEGRLKRKLLHFANASILDLTSEASHIF